MVVLQMKAINFRIDKKLLEKLELIKGFYGSSWNISEIIRNLLDGALQKIPIQNEEMFDPDIRLIAQKIDREKLLTQHELTRLSYYAASAYEIAGRKIGEAWSTYVTTSYIHDILSLLDILIKEPKLLNDEDTYYIYKRICPSPEGFQADRKKKESDTISSILALKEKANAHQITPGHAYYIAETLFGLLSDAKLNINFERLHRLMRPFLKSLLILAKYYLSRKNHSELACHFPDAAWFAHTLFSKRKENIGATDSIKKGNIIAKLFLDSKFTAHLTRTAEKDTPQHIEMTLDFPRLNDLLMIINAMKHNPHKTKSGLYHGEYYVIKYFTENGTASLQLTGAHQIKAEISLTEFEFLEDLLLDIREKYDFAWEALCTQWGAI